MNLPHAVSLAILLAATVSATALAKSSDRNQPMSLDADRSDCNLTNDGKCVFSGNVVIQQGTLNIRASNAEIIRRNGNITQVILTGNQVQMKQLLDDNSLVDASADR
ncbi:MAG: lipopolysaccharide transport periplasmic protein LptA, partial [Xanthomonadaceae bacterium]|nr:lipopolysaccharide transport periplasmic protein LptA [Xanthomonadaceae bacterium]